MNYKSFEFVIYNWLDGLNFIVCKVQKNFFKIYGDVVGNYNNS